MTFRFLEHTADARVECQAPSFEALLESAAQALYAITLREPRAAIEEERVIDVSGGGREDILVRWLQELVFLLEVGRFVAVTFAFDAVEAGRVRARLRGYLCTPEERAEEVKSATYHELEVIETGEGWLARVILDL